MLYYPWCSEVEGRDRLVKVDNQEKLEQLAAELGENMALIMESYQLMYILFTSRVYFHLYQHKNSTQEGPCSAV